MGVRDTDRGLAKRIASLEGLSRAVTVGVHGDQGGEPAEGGEITLAEVAAIHEFGLGVPERSFLRAFVDEHRTELQAMMRASAQAVAAGKLTSEVALERFGLRVVGMVKKRIVAGIDPPLAEATKEQKAARTGGPKDTPLILWGQLISSILHEVEQGRS